MIVQYNGCMYVIIIILIHPLLYYTIMNIECNGISVGVAFFRSPTSFGFSGRIGIHSTPTYDSSPDDSSFIVRAIQLLHCGLSATTSTAPFGFAPINGYYSTDIVRHTM